MSGRRWVLAAVLALLPGCVAPVTGDAPWLTAGRLAPPRPGLQVGEFAALRAERAPMLLVSVERDGRAAVFLRQGAAGGVERWRSIDNVGLSLRSGMLIATRGLGDDAMSIEAGDAAALVMAGGQGRITRIHRRLDGADRTVIDAFVCDIAPRGPRRILLGGARRDSRLVAEDCRGPKAAFTNLYWTIDGRVVQSRQWVSPGTGTLALRSERP